MAERKDSKLKDLWFGTQIVSSIVPGIILAVAIMLAAIFFTDKIGTVLPFKKNPLSPILVAIILGLIIANSIRLPKMLGPGIKFGVAKLLRFGIILMGIRLAITDILKIGSLAVFFVAICVTAAIAITLFVAKKIGIGEKLGTLIAAGTSICGVSAIVATAPAIEAEEEETAYAVATITIFGLLATVIYPYLTELVLHLPVESAGFFIGTAVNDTSQVTGTAMIYDQLWGHSTASGLVGSDIAITTKLVRNTFMLAVIPFLGFWFAKKTAKKIRGQKIQVRKYVPLFVLGYVLMGIVRTAGDGLFGSGVHWVATHNLIRQSAEYIIAVAIACVGLNTDAKRLAKLGYKPFLGGLAASFAVGMVSWLLVRLFGSYLRF
jgi:uncharacterized integral membrane protein (TIGR00698 family)